MDARDAATLGHLYEFDEDKMEILFDIEDDNGEMVTLGLPAKFEVCPLCNGKGSHVNPSIDANGLSAKDFAEDPSFAEDYFSGVYDQECNECGGKRVVPVPDEQPADKDVLAKFANLLQAEADYRREVAYEQRMGL
jgi:hypothetical protein